MPIFACLIARGSTILAEYSQEATNFGVIAGRLVTQIPSYPDSQKSYSYDNFNFHYVVERGITYICMTDQDTGFRVPYSFLFDLASKFKATYGDRSQTAGAMAMNDTFSRTIKERLDFYSKDPSADKMTKIKGDINDTKDQMIRNIDKVLERGEKIELLVDKTEDLSNQSHSFKSKSVKLKRTMWWKNAKLCCILITILVVVLASGILVALWKLGIFNGIQKSSSTTTGATSTGTSGKTSAASTTSATSDSSSTTSKPREPTPTLHQIKPMKVLKLLQKV